MNLSSKKIKVVYAADPIYSVNKEKRMVTCVLQYNISIPSLEDKTGLDPSKQWQKPSAHVHPYTGSLMSVYSRALFDGKKLKAIGHAVCSPDDEFDEEVGKKIALARAENKAYTNTLCIVDAAVAEITSVYTELVGIFAERMIKVIKANGAYLEKLTGDKFDFEKYIGIGADGGVDFGEGGYNSDDIPYEVIDTDSEKDEQ